MNEAARPWLGLVFKCLSALAFIGAFAFFMLMQEAESKYRRLREEGVVSNALVVSKNIDRRMGGRGGRGATILHTLHVRHVQKSNVKYQDLPSSPQESEFPIAPPKPESPASDIGYSGIMHISPDLYENTKIGDFFTVVNTPYDPESPQFIEEVTNFSPKSFYPGIGFSLLFGLIFWAIGHRISNASAIKGVYEIAKMPRSYL